MKSLKSLAYELDQEAFKQKYEDVISDDEGLENYLISQYPQFVAYLKEVIQLKESWALCYRSDLLLRGYNINTNAESQFLVIKDKILLRVK